MYIGRNLYENYAFYVDLPDVDFFKQSLTDAIVFYQKAKEEGLLRNISKKKAPVVFISNLASRTKDEEVVERAVVHDRKRAKRRFLMIDADFDTHQSIESEMLQEAIVEFATAHKTPYLIYPTLSYPQKPRFRAVLFTNQLLNAARYQQAMEWLHDQLGVQMLDESDGRVTTNRNLPVFNHQSQVDAILTNLTEEGLEPLDWSLWKDAWPLPKVASAKDLIDYDHTKAQSVRYDTNLLVAMASIVAQSGFVQKYLDFVRYLESVALEVVEGRIQLSVAQLVVQAFARDSEAPEHQKQKWLDQNEGALETAMRAIVNRPAIRARIRPLSEYEEFSATVVSGVSGGSSLLRMSPLVCGSIVDSSVQATT